MNYNIKIIKASKTLILLVGITYLFILAVTNNTILSNVDVAYGESNDSYAIYYDSTLSDNRVTESFSYVTKTTETFSINPSFPNYYNTNGSLRNTCANVAGANIIGFYDRYFENLIPNSVPGIGASRYIYYPMSKNIIANQAVINDLYEKMQTNVGEDGCTQDQYKKGISLYVQNHGYKGAFYSVMTNGNFDLDKAKSQLNMGNPISLYLGGFSFTNVTDTGNIVTFDTFQYDGNHIAITYGYEKVNYYNINGNIIRSEIYLKVSTGLNGVSGVYILNYYGNLYDAESINIQ